MRIAIIGTGYVGLVTGACFAQARHRVTCVDTDKEKIAALCNGLVPIHEPGLSAMIEHARRKRAIAFSSDAKAVASNAEIVFVAVGTPARESDGHADVSNVRSAITEIAPALRRGSLVVLKSTVPVGTGDEMQDLIATLRPDLDFDLASNPEFLRAGCAVRDFKFPDRVVIGAESERAIAALMGLYQGLGIDVSRIVRTQRRSAELIKYAANGFLATKIAFINEVADLCEHVGAQISDVAFGIGLDRRIGEQFLKAGPGFGGSCFPKDARALAKTAEEHGAPMRIIEAVLVSNDRRKRSIAGKIRNASGGDLCGKAVALLGLTFKPGTDDMRDAPSIALAEALVEAGAIVHAYDPVGMDRARTLLPNGVHYHATALSAARGADVAVVVTEWDEFQDLDLARLKREMAQPLLIDLRNMFSEEYVRSCGLQYCGIGNGSTSQLGRSMQPAWRSRRRLLSRKMRDENHGPAVGPLEGVLAAE